MSKMKSIASLFVNMDEEKPEASEAKPAPVAPHVQVLSTPLMSAGSSDPAAEGKVSEKLTKALEENNLQGIDFFEFRKTLDALVDVIPDEATRYRAAFSSLIAQGAAKENLVQTADHYLKVLDTKESGFLQYLEEQHKTRVQKKIDEAETIKGQIKQKSDQIALLTQEIGKLTECEINTRNEATLAKAELDAYRNTFQTVKARFTVDVQTTVNKISQYLSNVPKS